MSNRREYLYEYVVTDLAATLIGAYFTSRIFGGTYIENVSGNLFIMLLAEFFHWWMNHQPSQLSELLNDQLK